MYYLFYSLTNGIITLTVTYDDELVIYNIRAIVHYDTINIF